MSLQVKFSLFIILLVFTILSTITLLLIMLRTSQIKEELIEKDKIVSTILSQEFSASFADYYFYQYDTYRDFVQKKLQENNEVVYFIMYNANGEFLYDSRNPSSDTSSETNQTSRDPLVLNAIINRQMLVDIIKDSSQETIRVVIPYIDKFNVYRNGFEFHFSTKKISQIIRETVVTYSILLLIFIILSVGVTLLLVRQIVRPIQTLTQTASDFSKGDFSQEVSITTSDEIGTLAKAFNLMAKDLHLSHKRLTEQNKLLEEEVAKRTKELEDKITQMEKLNKLTIDRELKMIELKKELDQLKKQNQTT